MSVLLWCLAAAAALLLAMIHGIAWALDRRASPHLAFAVVALALVGVAAAELGMMTSVTAAEWGQWVQLSQVPLFFLHTGIAVFIRLYLGAGQVWMLWSIILLRFAILIANFVVEPNFNFERIDAIASMSFLGSEVSVVDQAVPAARQLFGTATTLLLLLYIVDAAVAHARARTQGAQRRALVVGVAVCASFVMAAVLTQLVLWGALRAPMLITPPFLLTLGAMAFELGRDTLRASRLARDLAESERRLDLAASAAGLGLWTWDRTRSQIWATDRARDLLGYLPTAPFDWTSLRALIHPDDLYRVNEAVALAVHRGAEHAVQFRVRHPTQGLRWIAARGSSEKDAEGMLRGVLQDVTDQKRAQDEAEELRRELAHAGRVTMLGQLASALAHELSQPLGAILRNAEAAGMMLQRRPLDVEELRLIVADIERDDRRAGEVIERLRALLKRRQMEFQPISLATLLQDVITLVRPDAAVRHISIECGADHSLPAVRGDRVHLSQVLINLIINAMDATSAATQSSRRVVVDAHSIGDALEVAVVDSGEGIPTERMDKIFQPFFTTKAGGMGMGLAVSRTIIEAHGGRLWAENTAEGGAVFRFRLPAVEDAA